MKRYMLLVLLATFAFASSVQAQGIFGFFNRKRPDPASHVPELIYKLKASRSYRERLVAADELRQYDPQQFPDIVPALVDALRTDTHYRVRLEAAQSLGRIRPINQAAGAALQQAASADQAWRVRLQAWSSLKVYQMAGYRSGKNDPPVPDPTKMNNEPTQSDVPIINRGPAGQPPLTSEPVPLTNKPPKSIFIEPPTPTKPTPPKAKTSAPPLIAPPTTTPEPPPTSRPLPRGSGSSGWTTAVPSKPNRIKPTKPVAIEEGPVLVPPPSN